MAESWQSHTATRSYSGCVGSRGTWESEREQCLQATPSGLLLGCDVNTLLVPCDLTLLLTKVQG